MGRSLVDASDDALVRAARVGDREAFEVIVDRHGPAMHAYARRVLRDDGDVQEAVQDALVAAWLTLGSFRSQSSLRTWLFRLTANKAIDLGRRSRAIPVDDALLDPRPAGHDTDPHVHLSQAQFLAALEAALGELPYRQRASWVLREVHGLTATEVGSVLSLSPGAVRGHLHRARRTLAERMLRWQ